MSFSSQERGNGTSSKRTRRSGSLKINERDERFQALITDMQSKLPKISQWRWQFSTRVDVWRHEGSGVMEFMYQASIERERCDSQLPPVSDRKGVSGNNAALQVRSEYTTVAISSSKGTEWFSQMCLIIKPYQSCCDDGNSFHAFVHRCWWTTIPPTLRPYKYAESLFLQEDVQQPTITMKEARTFCRTASWSMLGNYCGVIFRCFSSFNKEDMCK